MSPHTGRLDGVARSRKDFAVKRSCEDRGRCCLARVARFNCGRMYKSRISEGLRAADDAQYTRHVIQTWSWRLGKESRNRQANYELVMHPSMTHLQHLYMLSYHITTHDSVNLQGIPHTSRGPASRTGLIRLIHYWTIHKSPLRNTALGVSVESPAA